MIPRRGALLFLILASLAGIAILAFQSPKSPEDTIRAFAKALAADDWPRMARLVLGGKPDFKFAKLRQDDQELSVVYTRYDFKVKSVEVIGDRAMVVIESSSDTKGGEYGDSGLDKVPLQLAAGEWKIVPYTKASPTGYFIERRANVLAFPEETLAQLEAAYGPTRNIGAAEKKLGLERTRFFDAIFEVKELSSSDVVPWHGYKSMTMIEHTLVLWPVGRADEVVFDMGLEGAEYLTHWKKVNGKPKRMGQYRVREGEARTPAGRGTLSKWLAKEKSHLSGRRPAPSAALLNAVHPYAAYIEVGAIGMFMCYVIREDGTADPKKAKYGLDATLQDSYQLRTKGFFITPEEQMLLVKAGIG